MRLGIADKAVALGDVRRSRWSCKCGQPWRGAWVAVMRIKERGKVGNDVLRAEWRSVVVETNLSTAKCRLEVSDLQRYHATSELKVISGSHDFIILIILLNLPSYDR